MLNDGTAVTSRLNDDVKYGDHPDATITVSEEHGHRRLPRILPRLDTTRADVWSKKKEEKEMKERDDRSKKKKKHKERDKEENKEDDTVEQISKF